MPARHNDDVYLINDFDITAHEEKLQRAPDSVRIWLNYIVHKYNGSFAEICFTYERAVKRLPRSYCLWKQYLDFRREKLEGLNPVQYKTYYAEVNQCYENALVLLNKMPRIWLDYLEFLTTQPCITLTRRVFDRALRALPLGQHERVWELYVAFAEAAGGETARRIYRRYLTFDPAYIKTYVDHLVKMERYEEAAERMIEMINAHKAASQQQLWQDLCDILVNHCDKIKSIKAEGVIRDSILRFNNERGFQYCRLAMYWINMGQLEKARDVYEEGITKVDTVADFVAIYDAYLEFEESMITGKMELAQERKEGGEKDEEEDRDLDIRLLRLERLIDRRPFLVNNLLLRKNPNDVAQWEERVKLWEDKKEKVVETYTQAVQTIDPKKAKGVLQDLWVHFANFYEEGGDLDSARAIFEKAAKVNFKHVDDLAEIWCKYAEMELRHENYDHALEIMGRGTITPKVFGENPKNIKYNDESKPVQQRVFKSLKLWSFYVDLEESVGTTESTIDVYDKILELRIANPQVIVNYATFLHERQYFEESFKVYERGIELFGWPVAFELWNIYLHKFTERYKGDKLERSRELYEQALDKCPPKYAKTIYLSYAQLEGQYGLARDAMRIYDRATTAVADEDRLEMFKVYAAKAIESFGLLAAREIYEKAWTVLSDKDLRPIALQFAKLERKLEEIDRARAIYGNASQLFNPKDEAEKEKYKFWETWHAFEVQHGNEDTFKEMLRIKRSVQVRFAST